jgi:hypothetical protein
MCVADSARIAMEDSDRTGDTSKTAEAVTGSQPRMTISVRFLLAIYGILPLCFVAMALDKFLGGKFLSHVLPSRPQSFFIFQLMFGTPHIIASSVILASNGAYFRTYFPRVLIVTVLILLFFGVGSLFISYDVFLAIVGAVTILHVIKQQVGIGKGICRISDRVYDAWGWVLIVQGSLVYYLIFTSQNYSAETMAWILGVIWTLSLVVVLLTFACQLKVKTFKGRFYLWANALMVMQSGLFYMQGYSFLAILGPRLVHDLTAFTFYIAHDVNRHGERPQNLLYKMASKLGLGVFWVCPAIAVLLTFLIGRYIDPLANLVVKPVFGYDLPYAASFLIVGYLSLLHYYSESFTWKQDSPYRSHVTLIP